MASNQEVIFHIVVAEIPSTTFVDIVMSTVVQSASTHMLFMVSLL